MTTPPSQAAQPTCHPIMQQTRFDSRIAMENGRNRALQPPDAETSAAGPTAEWVGYLLVGVPVAAIVGLVAYSATQTSAAGWATFAVGSGVIAGAGAIGALLGFLFGIPRSLQTGDNDSASGPAGYRPNTNLEQISDWLTKILVGVGLVEFKQIGAPLRSLIVTVGAAMNDAVAAKVVAGTLLTVFTIWGFLVSYLITRTQAARVFRDSDIEVIARTVTEQVTQTLDEQSTRDAQLLSMVDQVLNPGTSGAAIGQDTLDAAMTAASQSARLQSFLLAHRQRQSTWREDRDAMKRTIPVFRALVASDAEGKYHRNHGELGFALKDLEQPQWADALHALDIAIKRRGLPPRGWELYEFNRALCFISLANAGTPMPDSDKRIDEDLIVVGNAPQALRRRLLNDPMVLSWREQRPAS